MKSEKKSYLVVFIITSIIIICLNLKLTFYDPYNKVNIGIIFNKFLSFSFYWYVTNH